MKLLSPMCKPKNMPKKTDILDPQRANFPMEAWFSQAIVMDSHP